MRIAVSGSHRVGKTSLAEGIAEALTGHDLVGEPYHDMVAEGHVFSHPPGVGDFEDQLEYALGAIAEDVREVVFDRSPVDLLVYLMVAAGDSEGVIERWRGRVRRAMRTLDAVVLVPIESPDRIEVTEEEDPESTRHVVDEMLRELLLSDGLDLGIEVIEVRGSLKERVSAVLRGPADLF